MPSNHIGVTDTTPIGRGVNSAIDQLRAARDQVHKMYEIMSEFSDDMTALGGELGIDATKAAIVKENFQNALTPLNGLDIQYLLSRLGQ